MIYTATSPGFYVLCCCYGSMLALCSVILITKATPLPLTSIVAPKAKEVGCLIFKDASWAIVHTAMNDDEVSWHTHTPSEDSLVDLDKKGLWALLLRGGLSVDGKKSAKKFEDCAKEEIAACLVANWNKMYDGQAASSLSGEKSKQTIEKVVGGMTKVQLIGILENMRVEKIMNDSGKEVTLSLKIPNPQLQAAILKNSKAKETITAWMKANNLGDLED